jgi:soluble lytic murein transglycosylase
MQAGSGFADAEFLAGWIALRFLHQPANALPHFEALAKAVSLPISKARAYYWLGRTEEELDRRVRAIADYREAALHRETFYGQLALARIDDNPILVLQPVSASNVRAEQAAFEADQRVAAIRLLADLNDREKMRLFAIRVANDTPQPGRLQMLAELMVSLGDPAMGVRVAKLASYNGVVLASNLAPTMTIPRFPGAGDAPEPALVLGLTRQESEFDPKAVSSAGARGLMQLMPATAKRAAQQNKMTYKLTDLTANPQYNMQLGMATISEYLEKWGGSYILGIASYNAGAGNVTRWVEANGDPRDPTVDPIDWIERIPFSETRNYVQRVLENLGVYHNRLGGNGKLTILADLHRPNLPRVIALKDQPGSPAPVFVEHPAPVVNSPATGQPVAVP